MICPDCSGALVEMSLSGLDKSFRCFTCGGIWLMSKTVNELVFEDFSQWQRIVIDPGRLGMGEHKCPVDQAPLELYTGDRIPTELKVRQCTKCRWLWFPEDSLFKFKPVQENRVREEGKKRIWMKQVLMSAVLPILSLVLLVTGVAVGLRLIGNQQRAGVEAAGKLNGIYVVKLTNSSLQITVNYDGDLKDKVFVFSTNEAKWVALNAVQIGSGRYQVIWDGATDSEKTLKVRIGGKETTVEVGP